HELQVVLGRATSNVLVEQKRRRFIRIGRVRTLAQHDRIVAIDDGSPDDATIGVKNVSDLLRCRREPLGLDLSRDSNDRIQRQVPRSQCQLAWSRACEFPDVDGYQIRRVVNAALAANSGARSWRK